MIQRKQVTCSVCHQQTSLYRVERDEIKRKLFVCSKHPKKESQRKETEHHEKLEKFYNFIHVKFGGICQETGKTLSYSNKQCAHILPKSKYDYFEFDVRNAILVSWSVHHIIDKGSAEQRKALKVWQRIQDTRKKLLEEVGLSFDEKHWETITF